MSKKHNHYFKDVSKLNHIDVYRVLDLYEVTNPCLQHVIKKLLVAGGRSNKLINVDVQEAIDSLERWKEMHIEDLAKFPQNLPFPAPVISTNRSSADNLDDNK